MRIHSGTNDSKVDHVSQIDAQHAHASRPPPLTCVRITRVMVTRLALSSGRMKPDLSQRIVSDVSDKRNDNQATTW
jgi:hypothetical protein